ncbi:hypothetical protein O77CONTIG1_02785 [Leptolyngbya sp. O-77]|nr:hypothetical protein O77CONTIG1_02785 [Leptolyngbya sp. O-77]
MRSPLYYVCSEPYHQVFIVSLYPAATNFQVPLIVVSVLHQSQNRICFTATFLVTFVQ